MNTIGSDPEIAFVSDGHIIPAGIVFEKCKDLFEYHPEQPSEEPGIPPKGAYLVYDREREMRLYADGMSNEFNMAASTNIKTLIGEFRELYKASLACAKKFGCLIEVLPFIPVTQADIDFGGVVCAQFGCDPDDSIYNDEFDPASIDARNHLARYFGCHIHSGMTANMLGYGGLDWVQDSIRDIILSYDLLVGITNVLTSCNENSRLRRKVYGRAGRYRIQVPYGWEYRCPDNYIMRSPQVLTAFFELSQVATHLAEIPKYVENTVLKDELYLFDVINGCNRETAVEIFENHVVPLAVGFGISNSSLEVLKTLKRCNGIENSPYYDFMKEWELE